MPSRPRRAAALLVVFAVLGSLSPALAQEQPFGDGGWELNAFGGVIDDRPEFHPQTRAFRIGHEEAWGARAGYLLEGGIFLQAEALYAVLDLAYTPTGGGRQLINIGSLFLTAGGGYSLRLHPRLQLFGRAAAGAVRWSGSSSSEVDWVVYAGGGGRYFVSRSLAVRLDAGMRLVPAALEDVRQELRPDLTASGEELWLAEITAGLSWFPGAR